MSSKAVERVRGNDGFSDDFAAAFVCDLSLESALPEAISSIERPKLAAQPLVEFDLATLIFVLSAIHPTNMATCLRNVVSVLKPGGKLLLRDYGLHDYSQIRFGRGSRVMADKPLYKRQDGTFTYFFSINELSEMLRDVGLDVIKCSYIHRKTENKQMDLSVKRVFIQAVAQKPQQSS